MHFMEIITCDLSIYIQWVIPKVLFQMENTAIKYHRPTEQMLKNTKFNEPWHGISNNVVCATSKASDQPAHTRSLIRAFASRLHILLVLGY